MQKFLKEILDDVKSAGNGISVPCPRCGKNHIITGDALNGVSRYVDVEICQVCEQAEALLDAEGKPLRLTRWECVKSALRGKTFLDFLRNRARMEEDLECELIIDNSDMPATFCWDQECRITSYGAEYFAPIMEAPYEVLNNGNIEIFCDDYELGKEFVMAAAGYIGESEYKRMFEVPPMDNIRVDNAGIRVNEDGVSCDISLNGVDVNERFSLTVSHWNAPVRFSVVCQPESGNMKCRYSVGQMEADYSADEVETGRIRAAMEEACVREHGCSLRELWNSFTAAAEAGTLIKAQTEELVGNYEFTEYVCANTPGGSHMLIMRILCKDTGETVWAIGDDQVCAVTREDCVRNRNVPYNSVLIQEFPYQDNTPQSTGKWRPVVEELVNLTITKYLEHDGLVHVYPQWVPEQVYAHLGKELFDQMCENCDHIILHNNNMMDFVPKKNA